MANSPRPSRERDGQPAAVDRAADDDDADQRAEEERREDPAVELQPAELVGDDRHDRRDRQRFEADERDGQDQAERQRAPVRAPQAVRWSSVALVDGGLVHPERMAERPARRGRRVGRWRGTLARVAAEAYRAFGWYRGPVTTKHIALRHPRRHVRRHRACRARPSTAGTTAKGIRAGARGSSPASGPPSMRAN